MRKIKFRGKRIDDGEWVYGYYWHNEKYDEHIIFDQRKCHEVDPIKKLRLRYPNGFEVDKSINRTT